VGVVHAGDQRRSTSVELLDGRGSGQIPHDPFESGVKTDPTVVADVWVRVDRLQCGDERSGVLYERFAVELRC
jgi:hypothetical protein